MNEPPIIAVTAGDPGGIGPEVCLRAAQSGRFGDARLVVFGDAGVFGRVARELSLQPLPAAGSLDQAIDQVMQRPESAVLYDLDAMDAGSVTPGEVSAITGKASYSYITASIDAALAGKVDAVATGPIHKEALRLAGVRSPGHTEIFAERTGSDRACMMLTSSELTCSFITTHVGYRDVPSLLSIDRIVDVIELSHEAILKVRQASSLLIDDHSQAGSLRHRPRLAVCGLNPHAGENGLFGGGEEEAFILPAIQIAKSRGMDVTGPLPPDTAFLPARRRQMDCVVCMYHDQGHIPLKTLAFDTAVNITLGLPIIRTSVDHGTALDIAWQGKADSKSMVEAIRLATKLTWRKHPACDFLDQKSDGKREACPTGEER